ncbi:2-C-methyl-D-erythritol 2,4-cyclodiphosphate synthase [candidate division NPL-UPA2 bacterium]|nr:2-C-methyl-D-erythritol 2,4-cyclodiphosphate synthase [candidate division NPL-UPA2 bacterium]
MQVGMGFDVHQLVEGRKLILGGVEIPFPRGLAGYSDGDVLLHALGDALLGAAGQGDIGQHFPDDDPQYKGISSLVLLERICEIIRREHFIINNIDSIIVAEKPRLSPYLGGMKDKLAPILKLSEKLINIKATTSEGLGFTGREEGIAAYAVATLTR